MPLGRFRLLALFSFVGLFLALSSSVLAVSQSSILVNIVPENPAPGENVVINLSSYASNLDSVLISWTVDGKSVSAGIGKKSFSLTAPDLGEEKNVVATISLPDGSIQTRIVIRPSEMTLLWQANDSYLPPFYKGKARPTAGSQIKIVAMPEVRTDSTYVNPKNMVYAWKEDYTNNQGASGYGKNYFIYTNDYLEGINSIQVTASTTDQRYSSGGNIEVGTVEPRILFYKNDPVYGTLWESAIGDGHRIQSAEIIEAAPYFISPKEIRIPNLVFNWFINDYQVEVPMWKKHVLPVQAQADTSGTSKIRLEIENMDKIFQSAKREIVVEF
jgi:hypothetical protein